MKQVCKFNKKCDIVQTVPGLQVNIPDAIDYYRIKDTSVPSQYNGQKLTSEVGNRLAEPFDVIEYDRAYTRIRKNIKDMEYEKNRNKE